MAIKPANIKISTGSGYDEVRPKTTMAQVEELNSTISTINGNIADKQEILVSGENIKTINGVSVLGSGNLVLPVTGHTHDDRYFTESEADARFLGINAKAADSDKLDGYNSTGFIFHDEVLMPTNSFGGRKLYINSIDNAMYAADKKWIVTVTRHLVTYNNETYPKLNPDYSDSYSITGSGTTRNVTSKPSHIIVFEDNTLKYEPTHYSYDSVTGNILFNYTPTGIIYVYPGHEIPQYIDSPVDVTLSGKSLFDGSYESSVQAPNGYYLKINIKASESGYSIFGGYPYGKLFLSYYYTGTPDKAEYRVYNYSYRPHIPGWKKYDMLDFAGTNSSSGYIQYRDDSSNYGRTIMEFIVYGHDTTSAYTTSVTQIDWQLSRPNLSTSGSTVTKYGDNKLYHYLYFGDRDTNKITLNPNGDIIGQRLFEGANRVYSPNNKPTLGDLGAAASGHVHGYLKNDGVLDTFATPQDNDYVVITDANGSHKIVGGPQIKTTHGDTYLRRDGTWQNPPVLSHSHGSITNDGKIGTEAGRVIVTATGGLLAASAAAPDSVKLNGQEASYYSISGHTHDDRYFTETETNTLLNAKLNVSLKGAVSGLAELDANGKVPASQLPSFVDDVLEYANYDSFPASGESGKIYIALNTGKTYRWGGSAYVVISETLALGELETTAYRGDRGKTAYDHSQKGGNAHGMSFSQLNSKPTTLNGYGITDASLNDHTHGNITNDGKIGTDAGRIVVTATGGLLATSAAAPDSVKLNGIDSLDYKNDTHTKHSASNLAVGWYTIATNTGDRAIGRFGIRDTASGYHQAVVFYASHHYGNASSNALTVLMNSSYGTTPFQHIRIKSNGTYDGAAIQVYIHDASNNVDAYLLGDNFQSSGWVLKDWVPDATDPGDLTSWASFTEKTRINLDNISQGGISTTGPIYGGHLTVQKEVIYDDDARLTNARPASDVEAWAKAAEKPAYTSSEVGASPDDHVHGYLKNDGVLDTTVTPENGDYVVVTNANSNPIHKIARGPLISSTHNDQFLRKDGTWQNPPTPSHTHGSITNDGKIGTEAGLVVVTATGGLLATSAAAPDSTKLGGLELNSTTRNNEVNKVVRTDGNGYANFGWINTTSGNTTGAVSDVYVNTSDGYIRKKTLALFKTELGSMPASDVSSWAKQSSLQKTDVETSLEFKTTNSSGAQNIDNVSVSGNYYNSGTMPKAGRTDGGMFVNAYSSSWIAQIWQDYRDGELYARGKNNGAWQPWRQIIDSVNMGSVISITKSQVSDFPASMPASDVSAWAKAAEKPSYNFSEIGNTPTTLSGYGITDAAEQSHAHGYIGSSGNVTVFGTPESSDYLLISNANSSPVHKIMGGPQISSTHNDQFLRKDGTWQNPPAPSHTHGNITNDGKIGITSGLPVVTGSNGVLSTTSLNTAFNKDFGSSAGQVAEGNHSHGYISNTGTVTATTTPATYDTILISDNTYSHQVRRGPIISSTHNDQFLRKDGTWQTPPSSAPISTTTVLTDTSSSSTTPVDFTSFNYTIPNGKLVRLVYKFPYYSSNTSNGIRCGVRTNGSGCGMYGMVDVNQNTTFSYSSVYHSTIYGASGSMPTTYTTSNTVYGGAGPIGDKQGVLTIDVTIYNGSGYDRVIYVGIGSESSSYSITYQGGMTRTVYTYN